MQSNHDGVVESYRDLADRLRQMEVEPEYNDDGHISIPPLS
ncbi:MAG: hypothetical protein ACT4OF_14790 [Caulobacteraceae bacterium]